MSAVLILIDPVTIAKTDTKTWLQNLMYLVTECPEDYGDADIASKCRKTSHPYTFHFDIVVQVVVVVVIEVVVVVLVQVVVVGVGGGVIGVAEINNTASNIVFYVYKKIFSTVYVIKCGRQ
jgi:hypothetical protein